MTVTSTYPRLGSDSTRAFFDTTSVKIPLSEQNEVENCRGGPNVAPTLAKAPEVCPNRTGARPGDLA